MLLTGWVTTIVVYLTGQRSIFGHFVSYSYSSTLGNFFGHSFLFMGFIDLCMQCMHVTKNVSIVYTVIESGTGYVKRT